MIDFSNVKSISIPEGIVTKIISNGVILWQAASGIVNWVKKSINSDGSIYNGTGYKNGYRIRSGGAEGTSANTTCTGFIAVQPGNIIRVSGWQWGIDGGASNAINVADSGFNNLGQITGQPANSGIFSSGYGAYSAQTVVVETNGVWKWTVPPVDSGVCYIRVTGYNSSGTPGQNLIVTINEEIV